MSKILKPASKEEIAKIIDQKLSKFTNNLDQRFDKVDTALEVANERTSNLRKDMNQRFDQVNKDMKEGFKNVDDQFGDLHTAIQTFVGDATPLPKWIEATPTKNVTFDRTIFCVTI